MPGAEAMAETGRAPAVTRLTALVGTLSGRNEEDDVREIVGESLTRRLVE